MTERRCNSIQRYYASVRFLSSTTTSSNQPPKQESDDNDNVTQRHLTPSPVSVPIDVVDKHHHKSKRRRKHVVTRIFFPFETVANVLPDEDLKKAIVDFSQQVGVVFTLLASISAGGLFLEPLVEATRATAPHAMIVACPQVPMYDLGLARMVNHHIISLCHVAAPLFCISTFLNLYGLVNAINVMGRAQILPADKIPDFVYENSFVLHSTFWVLLPAVSSFAGGVVCTLDILYGEPLSSITLVSSSVMGLTLTRNLFSVGYYMENTYDERTRKTKQL